MASPTKNQPQPEASVSSAPSLPTPSFSSTTVVHRSTATDEIPMASPTRNQSRPASSSAAASSPSRKRTKRADVRAIGGHIYDPERRKSCHQCRQKSVDFVASCKQMKRGGRFCSIRFCHKCLLNRYGVKAEEIGALNDWICPKCRGVCNCSVCMKQRGQVPTGRVPTARVTGYSSVTEMLLHHEGSTGRNVGVGPAVRRELGKEVRKEGENEHVEDGAQLKEEKYLDVKIDEEMSMDSDQANISFGGDEDNETKFERKRKRSTNLPVNGSEGNDLAVDDDNENTIILPESAPLITIAEVEWAADDVGHVLQFMEFGNAFSRVLDLQKDLPETILREIATGHIGNQASPSLTIQFHMKLLSLIQENQGEEPLPHTQDDASSWLHDLVKCIAKSQFTFKELPLDCLDGSLYEYDNLDASEKLRILNFLCDEALNTEYLRIYIDEENIKILEKKKEEKGKRIAAKKKEKDLKQKMKDEKAKAMRSWREGVPFSISEHVDFVSKIRSETERAHAELIESTETLLMKKQRQDALRTEPLCSDQNGRVFWRLGRYGSSVVFLQEIHSQEMILSQDKWFTLDKASEQEVDKHITSLSQWSRQRRKSRRRALPPDAERAEDVEQ